MGVALRSCPLPLNDRVKELITSNITQKQVERNGKDGRIMPKVPKVQLTVNMTRTTAEALDEHLEESPYNRSTYIEVAVKEKLSREAK